MYSKCIPIQGGIPYRPRRTHQQPTQPVRTEQFVTVRDGNGDINMDFYFARARKMRSDAAHSFFKAAIQWALGK